MSFNLKARQVDDHRRVVLPESCPPHSAVTIQEIDQDTWLVKRQRKSDRLILVAIERFEPSPDHPDWQEAEKAMVEYAWKSFPPPES